MVGAVLDGTADAHSAVCLHLHTDDAESVPRFLAEHGIPAEESSRHIRLDRDRSVDAPVWLFSADDLAFDVTVLAHRPVVRPTVCWAEYIPSVTAAPGTPHVITLADTRWHTDWVAVPEGYAIPYVKGVPQLGAGGLTAGSFWTPGAP